MPTTILFTIEEMRKTVNNLNINRAEEPNRISPKTLTYISDKESNWFLGIQNRVLK